MKGDSIHRVTTLTFDVLGAILDLAGSPGPCLERLQQGGRYPTSRT